MREDALYAEYLAGDAGAGDRLMLLCADALMAYIDAFLHNPQDAEELMLDCFAVLLVKKPKVRQGNLRAYLFRMGRYKANRLWKNRFKRREFALDETLSLQSDSGDASPEEAYRQNERHDILGRCLNRIALQYREALWLVYDRELSYAQAAEVLGCGTKKIEDMLRNGKKQLRRELEKEGITRADL